MGKLYSQDIMATPLSMPFYFLAGFALELSFKAVVMAGGGDEPEIIALGHDLKRGYQAALSRGYEPRSKLWLGRMVEAMAQPHQGFELRYIPDVEKIELPRPDIFMKVLSNHLDAVEEQFAVWDSIETSRQQGF